MKKSLLIAALTLVSASAFASRARLSALQSSAQLSDVQDVLTKPNAAILLPEFATLEFGTAGSATGGASTTTGQATANGGFSRKMGDSAYGAYLGNKSVSQTDYRAVPADTQLLGVENGLNLFYATKMSDLTVGAGIYYSASSRKPDGTATTANKSQDASSIMVSAAGTGTWDAQLILSLANNSKYNTSASNENSMTGKTGYKLAGGYRMGSMYYFANYEGGGASLKSSTATLNDISKTAMTIGAVDSIKMDGTEFFYGASYVMTTTKDDGTGAATATSNTKTETAKLPLIVGMESELASWLVARGSITQSVLVDTKKVSTTTSTTTNDSNASDTTVAAGLGLKFGKFIMDGTLAAASSATGTFGSDGTNFLASSSFTYMF